MENASKALIIAGAILLAILLISFGIMVFTQAQNSVNDDGLKQEAAQTFNTKLLGYSGKNRTAADVKAVASLVAAINSSDSNSEHMVGMQITAKTTGIISDSKPVVNPSVSKILNNKLYDIDFSIADDSQAGPSGSCKKLYGYETTKGYVFKVVCTEK